MPFEHQRKNVGWQVSETCGVTNYGSGWRKDVVNRCLEFAVEHWVFLLLGLTSTETTTVSRGWDLGLFVGLNVYRDHIQSVRDGTEVCLFAGLNVHRDHIRFIETTYDL